MNPRVIAGIVYLFAANTAGFVLMGADKQKARNQSWRIPEKVFFIVSILGGSAGSFAGMYVFRHKTKHWYFVVFIPLILVVQIITALILAVTV